MEKKKRGDDAALYMSRLQRPQSPVSNNSLSSQVHCVGNEDCVDGHTEAMVSIVVHLMLL